MTEEDSDNPWANAAATNETSAKTSFRITGNDTGGEGHNNPHNDGDEESVDPEGCGFLTLYKGLQVWHGLDIILGILMIVYACVQKPHVSATVFLVALSVGILVAIRSLTGTLALATDHQVRRLALRISAGTSPILACTWFVLMCINLVVPGHVRQYLQQHKLLWKGLQTWEASHKGTLTLIFLGICVLECIRWQLVMKLHHQLERLELQEEAEARRRADRQISSPHRPWWWHKHSQHQLDPNDPLTDSLLPVTADRTGEDYDHSGWTFFGRKKKRTRNNSNNVRDDASVDFASVQEEWASRAEEDPYWWSRDDDEERPKVVSWAKGGQSPSRNK